ncbi:MAG: acyltransferase family protein [Methylocella sp.]
MDSRLLRYRADLDGLRATAILSVVTFHLSPSALPGGYLGVDMFFVLSGFLITSIIWSEAQDLRFSIVRFYDRRIRRIMPALLLLSLMTTLAAMALLLPSDLIGYGKSLLATLAFVANIYFWRTLGYFDHAAEEKPLLHIWSLGVEEQFYILFPLILALLARYWRRGALPTVIAFTLCSFALNMFALKIDASNPAFFLLPTRAWELGFGATLALLSLQEARRAALPAVSATLGALLVIMGLAHPLIRFVLLPVGLPVATGTALVIFAGHHNPSTVNRILCWRPLVFVGLISYSLYLWHWPVIVLARYYLVRELNMLEMAEALAFMTVCAIVSWRFVERPFRSKKMPIRTVRYAVVVGVAALGVAATLLIWSNGLPRRLNVEAAKINEAVGTTYRCPMSDYLRVGLSRACVMHLPSRNPEDADVVLLGNSHAQMYAPLWAAILADRNLTGLLIPVLGCLPTTLANISRECHDFARRNLAAMFKLRRVKTVILGTTWWHESDALVDSEGRIMDNRGNSALIAALDDLIAQLRRSGKDVVLIGPLVEPGWDIASTLSRELAFGRTVDRLTYSPASDFMRRFEPAIRHFEARTDVRFVRPDQVQCHAGRCDYLIDGRSLFSDENHIAVGALPRFRAVFEAAFPPLAAQ